MELEIDSILIVRPRSGRLSCTQEWLQSLGFQTTEVTSAAEAARALEQPFDAVLLSLSLPDLPGTGLLGQIHRKLPLLPVIAVAEDLDVDTALVAFRSGAVDVLSDDFDFEELHRCVERFRARRSRVRMARGREQRVTTQAPSVPTPSVDVDQRVEITAGSPTPQPPLAPPSDSLLNSIQQGELELPIVSPQLSNINDFLARDDYSIQDLSQVVGSDPALTARTIQRANSASFGQRAAVGTIEQACARLAAQRIVGLALEAALEHQFDVTGNYREIMRLACRGAAVTARVARQVARQYTSADPDKVHVAALLHNIGELGCWYAVSQRLAQAASPAFSQDPKTLVWEAHESVGALIATRWSLPKYVARVAEHHHSPRRAPEPSHERKLRSLVLGSWLVAVEEDLAPQPPVATSSAGSILEFLGLTSADVKKVAKFARNLELA